MTILVWMAYCVLIGACVLATAEVTDRLRRASGRTTRGVWVVALAACVALSTGVALRPRTAPVPEVPSPALVQSRTAIAEPIGSSVAADQVVLWLWLFGSMTTLGLLAVGVMQLNNSRRSARRAVLSGREVAITDHVGPGAVAFGAPRILVPQWVEHLTPECIELLVAHEDEHVRSHDAAVALAATLPVILMPWNPALWWGVRRLRTAMEVDCDARVLRAGHSIKQYAELLLSIAGRGRTAGLPALLPFFNSTSQLQHRILAMTSSHTLTRSRKTLLLIAGTVAVFVACETRRPEPLAPISDVAIVDGKAQPLKLSDEEAALRKQKTEAALAAKQTGDVTLRVSDDPVVVVRNASGTVVHKGRLDDAEGKLYLESIPADQIERVEVIKGKAALPQGAKGGLIEVQLKPGAKWTSADAAAAAKVRESGDSSVMIRKQKSGETLGTIMLKTKPDTLH